MSHESPTKLEKLFQGTRSVLENEGRYFSSLSDHQGEKGRLNETHLKATLRRHLPEKFGLGTGFIVSSKTINNKDNPQIDIVIYDKVTNAPLYQSEAFGVFPVESVYGYIEVKTTLTKSELASAFKANVKIRNIASSGDKVYLYGTSTLSPRFYLFAYKSSVTAKTTIKHVKKSFELQGDAHAHGIFILEQDLFIARKALYDAEKVELHVSQGPTAFAEFMVNMVMHCETMIPPSILTIEGQKYVLPHSTTLPPGNIARYFGKNE